MTTKGFLANIQTVAGDLSESNRLPVSSIDSQISAIEDDGTDYGVIRSKIVSGELVPVALNQMYFINSAAWTAAWDAAANGDGTGMCVTGSLSAGLGAMLRFTTSLYGRTVGIRFRGRTGDPLPDLTIVVDGVPYRGAFYKGIERASSLADYNFFAVVVGNLPNRLHQIDIIIHADATTAKSYTIYGGLAERQAGYSTPSRNDLLYNQGTLTTNAVEVPTTVAADNTVMLRGFKSIIYYNSGSVDRKVTVYYGNPAGVNTEVWGDTIAAGKTAVFSPGSALLSFNKGFSSSNVFNHKADAVTDVKFSMIGGL